MASTDEERARMIGLSHAGVDPSDLDGALALFDRVFHRLETVDDDLIEERYGQGDYTRGLAALAVAEMMKS